MTTKEQGSIGEAMALYDLQNRNIRVSLPFTDNASYDMIADINGLLLRLQIKTSTVDENGTIVFQLGRTRINRKRNVHKAYSNEEIDAYVLCDLVTHNTYYMWLDESPARAVKLRYKKALNNQHSVCRFIENYTFERFLNKRGIKLEQH